MQLKCGVARVMTRLMPLVEDGKIACLDDRMLIHHPVLTFHQKLLALRFPLLDAAPLISVLIPYHNAAKYFNVCLAGLAEQTFRNFELVVHDDGSDQPLSRERGLNRLFPAFR